MSTHEIRRYRARTSAWAGWRPASEVPRTPAADGAGLGSTRPETCRFERRRVWPDRQWEKSIFTLNGTAVEDGPGASGEDGRNGHDPGMLGVPGGGSRPWRGQWYASTFHDKAGEALVATRSYRIVLQGEPPVSLFWAMTLHDQRTGAALRGLGDVPPSGLSSCSKIERNADGSVELFVGPRAPRMKRTNWIATVPGRRFFARFRLFGPLGPVVAGSWQLDDLEEVVPWGASQPTEDPAAAPSSAGAGPT